MTDETTLEELEALAESGFTAGPWRLGCNLTRVCTAYHTDEDTLPNGWAKSVAKINHPKWMGILQSAANGKLIAAAPSLLATTIAAKKREKELLEALRNIRVSLGNVGEVVWQVGQPETTFDYITRMIGDELTRDEYEKTRASKDGGAGT